MKAKTLHVVLVTCNGKHFAALAKVPRQFKYDTLRRASWSNKHPLHVPLMRYGADSFTFDYFPCTLRESRAYLEQIREEYSCYTPRGFNPAHVHTARATSKLIAKDRYQELYNSYLLSGDTPASAADRARMAMAARSTST